jgi:DNA polymerase-1
MNQNNNKKKVSHKLEDVLQREMGVKLDKEHQVSDWSGDLTQEMLEYAARDAEVLLPLAEALESKIEDANLQKAVDIEHRMLPAVAWMSGAGVPFDAEGWRKHLDTKETELEPLKASLNNLAPPHPEAKEWNWNSPSQVIEAFRQEEVRCQEDPRSLLVQAAR